MKKTTRVFVLALVALSAISLAGCDFLAELIGAVMLSVEGTVVNAQADGDSLDFYKAGTETLAGATITLTNQSTDGTDATGTVDSDGSFIISDVEPGRYLVSGTKTGWVFVPRMVDITGFMSSIPTVLAYPTPTDTDQILILVEWEKATYDVDSYMVRDLTDNDTMDGTIIAAYDVTDTEGKVSLDRDITSSTAAAIPRVETMRISAPKATNAFELLRFYIRMYTSTGSLTGDADSDPAGATVFVMQGSEHMGTYPIAYNSYENVLGVVAMRWNNGAATPYWDIGSFGGAWLTGDDGTGTSGIKSVGFAPVVVETIQ